MGSKHDLMRTMLIDTADVLSGDRKVFWIEYGTLLGFVRDGGFLEWENDVDIGMWKEEKDLLYKKKLEVQFRKLGYETCFSDGHFHINPKNNRLNVELDINFYEKNGRMAVKPIFVARNKVGVFLKRFVWSLYDMKTMKLANNRLQALGGTVVTILPVLLFHMLPTSLREMLLPRFAKMQHSSFFLNKSNMVPVEFFEEIKMLELFGYEFPVPKDAEGYLAYKFGEDWRTPNKDWDSLTQDKALLGNR